MNNNLQRVSGHYVRYVAHRGVSGLLRLRLKSVLLLLLFACYGCSHTSNDAWTGRDKGQHFFASAAMAAAGTAYAEQQNLSAAQSRRFGILFSVSLGIGKELYDSREKGSGWSWKDLAWDAAGAFSGYALYDAWSH